MSEYITTALQEAEIKTAPEKLAELIRSDFARIDRLKADAEVPDFSKLDTITIGVMPADGLGPLLLTQALRVLNQLLAPEIASGKVKIRIIEGMTFERRVELGESLPADVLAACKECNVLIKGPFVTPRAGDPWPNLVSANSLLRRNLELFAAVRPIKIPEKNIDWCFFRENIEGEYIWGNKGIQVKVTGKTGSWYAVSYNGLSGYMSADYVKLSTGNAVADKIVATARQYLGTPYVYGGSSPRGLSLVSTQ